MLRQYTLVIFYSIFVALHMPYAQNSNTEFLNCIEDIYGANDLLVNGAKYIPKNSKITGHPFYLQSGYLNGKVFIRGKSFSDLLLKYDLLNDDLVLLQEYKNGLLYEIVLNYELVDSFHISPNAFNTSYHTFVNKKKWDNSETSTGYLKIIYTGTISFFRKNKKLFYPLYSDKNPFGLFNKEPSYIYIYDGKSFIKLKNKRAFLSVFKEYKTELKKFMKKHHIKFKKANDDQLFQLFKYLDKLREKR